MIVYVTKNEVTTFGLNNKLVEFSAISHHIQNFSNFYFHVLLLSRVIFYIHKNTINRSLEFGDVKNEKRRCLSTGLLEGTSLGSIRKRRFF